MSVKIYIPTKGRINDQETIRWIPSAFREKTFLVCPEEEQKSLEHRYGAGIGGVLGTPPAIVGIAATRQWIIDGAETDIVIMLDDDQHFQKRLPGKWNLKGCDDEQMQELLEWIVSLANEHAMVGLSARQGNNRSFPNDLVYNVRTYNSYALRPQILKDHGIRFDELPLMEDFNVVLRLLRLGYSIPSIQKFCWGQTTSNAKGGCSSYRTAALQEECARRLESLHPGYVKTVHRNAKSWAGGLDSRVDVRVSWKKAYDSAETKRSV